MACVTSARCCSRAAQIAAVREQEELVECARGRRVWAMARRSSRPRRRPAPVRTHGPSPRGRARAGSPACSALWMEQHSWLQLWRSADVGELRVGKESSSSQTQTQTRTYVHAYTRTPIPHPDPRSSPHTHTPGTRQDPGAVRCAMQAAGCLCRATAGTAYRWRRGAGAFAERPCTGPPRPAAAARKALGARRKRRERGLNGTKEGRLFRDRGRGSPGVRRTTHG
jgi:hypothetical protein